MRSYERDVGGDGWHDALLMELVSDTAVKGGPDVRTSGARE
jgi:hypothetical protein